MAFHYDRVVPWGRSFDEYGAMFALSAGDLEGRLLGCGDGPASFNAELSRRGGRVVSVDPLYALGPRMIERRMHEAFATVIAQTRREQHRFVWRQIRSVDELGEVRMRAMRAFLADFASARRSGRYLAGSLPAMPFENRAFDLAVCSHLLFLYSEQLDFAFHRAALVELARVAAEVRVFPLLDVNAETSCHLEPLRRRLAELGFETEIRRVPYEFQRGGDRMLSLSGPATRRDPDG